MTSGLVVLALGIVWLAYLTVLIAGRIRSRSRQRRQVVEALQGLARIHEGAPPPPVAAQRRQHAEQGPKLRGPVVGEIVSSRFDRQR